jgi:hypothetical protein
MEILPYTLEVLVNDFNVLEGIQLFRCNAVCTVTEQSTAKLGCQQHEIQTFYCVLWDNMSLSIQYFLMMTLKIPRNMLQYKCSII